MHVSEIMTSKPITIHPDRSLAEAMALMKQVGCRHLPVISSQGHLIGILSDRDCRTALNSPHIMRERWQDEELLNHLPVRAAMTPAPIITEPNESAREAARLILEHQISCLPVMRGETLVGIVTTSDILMAFVNSERYTEAGAAL